MHKWVAFALLVAGAVTAAAQGGGQSSTGSGRPARQQQGSAAQADTSNPNVKKGSIEGVVTSSSGEPLRKAEVRAFRIDARSQGAGGFPPTGPGGTMVLTDDAGKFLLADIEPGRYAISAQRTGYVSNSFGPGGRGGRGGGVPILLAEGQEMKGVEIKLFKQGVISGRVVDEDGEPLQNAQVQLMQQRYMRGRRQMMPMQGAQVNDLGEYRVASLPPGKYYVSVHPQRMMMMRGEAPPPSDKPYDEGYTTMYYPNATDTAQATLVEVTQGGEISGIDFRMRKVRTYRIRGKVLDPNGQPARNVFLSAMPAGEGGFMFFRGGGAVRGQGVFELSGLTPGQYNLMAGRANGGERLSMMFPVTLGEQHLNDVVIQLAEPLTIKATARVEGKDKVDLGGARLMFESQNMGMPFMNNGATAKEGVFEVTGISPGKYRATVIGLPDGHFVKSVRVSNQEVPNQMVDFSAGAGPVELVLSDKAGQVSGTVQDADGKAQVGVTVVAMPADLTKRDGMEAFRVVQSDQTGAFTLRNLPPGEWVAFAFADAEDGAYQDPEWIKKFENNATKVSLKESGSESLTLKVLQ